MVQDEDNLGELQSLSDPERVNLKVSHRHSNLRDSNDDCL